MQKHGARSQVFFEIRKTSTFIVAINLVNPVKRNTVFESSKIQNNYPTFSKLYYYYLHTHPRKYYVET